MGAADPRWQDRADLRILNTDVPRLDGPLKVTGRADVVGDESVMSAFANPAAFVQQYRMDPGSVVWVLFDRAAIKRVLDRGGQPVWGEERPATLVWLVIDDRS